MKRLLLAVAIVVAGLVGVTQCGCSATAIPTDTRAGSEAKSDGGSDSSFARAFADRAGNLELQGHGTVSDLLTDDTDGARVNGSSSGWIQGRPSW